MRGEENIDFTTQRTSWHESAQLFNDNGRYEKAFNAGCASKGVMKHYRLYSKQPFVYPMAGAMILAAFLAFAVTISAEPVPRREGRGKYNSGGKSPHFQMLMIY